MYNLVYSFSIPNAEDLGECERRAAEKYKKDTVDTPAVSNFGATVLLRVIFSITVTDVATCIMFVFTLSVRLTVLMEIMKLLRSRRLLVETNMK